MLELHVQKQLKAAQGQLNLDIGLKCEPGEFLVISGESGAGKTSILRMIAGLLKPDSGIISYEGKVWFDQKINCTPQQRSLGLVFQQFSLFPNMTVEGNLKFALKKGQSETLIAELLQLMELEGLKHEKPSKLSGGQKQRVALARALVQQPKLLLLDEPLSALDRIMRLKLQEYIKKIHREFKLTTIMVTHDPAEATRLADRMIVIEGGKVIKEGRPAEIFGHKALSGKFQFTGTIIEMVEEDVLTIAAVLVGNQVVKVVLSQMEQKNLRIGDEVIVASKAFNPIIKKI